MSSAEAIRQRATLAELDEFQARHSEHLRHNEHDVEFIGAIKSPIVSDAPHRSPISAQAAGERLEACRTLQRVRNASEQVQRHALHSRRVVHALKVQHTAMTLDIVSQLYGRPDTSIDTAAYALRRRAGAGLGDQPPPHTETPDVPHLTFASHVAHALSRAGLVSAACAPSRLAVPVAPAYAHSAAVRTHAPHHGSMHSAEGVPAADFHSKAAEPVAVQAPSWLLPATSQAAQLHCDALPLLGGPLPSRQAPLQAQTAVFVTPHHIYHAPPGPSRKPAVGATVAALGTAHGTGSCVISGPREGQAASTAAQLLRALPQSGRGAAAPHREPATQYTMLHWPQEHRGGGRGGARERSLTGDSDTTATADE